MARHPQPATRGGELGAARCGGAVRATRFSRRGRGKNAPRSVTRKGRRFLRRSSLMTTRPKKSKLVVVHLNSNIPQDRLPLSHALRRPITGFLAGRARRSTVVKVLRGGVPTRLFPRSTPTPPNRARAKEAEWEVPLGGGAGRPPPNPLQAYWFGEVRSYAGKRV